MDITRKYRILEKVAARKSDPERSGVDWLKLLPGLGTVAGGVLGAIKSRKLPPKTALYNILFGAGVGGTTGWLPSTVRDTVEELQRHKGKKIRVRM